MITVFCPLCAAGSARPMLAVGAAELARAYQQRLGLAIAAELGDAASFTLYRCVACELQFFEPPRPASGAFYAELQHAPWYYQRERAEFSYTAAWLRPDDSVLEIGGGAGAFAQTVRPGRYVGLELNPQAAASARQAGIDMRLEPLEQHAAQHPAAYDLVCAFQVLEHLPDPRGFFVAALACLRPGGLLALSTPSADSFLADAPDDILNMPPHHISRWSDRCYRIAAALFGIECLTIRHEPLADYHRDWYGSALVLRALRRAGLGLPPIATRPAARALRGAAALLGRLLARLPRRSAPPGHTVWVLYRRPGR